VLCYNSKLSSVFVSLQGLAVTEFSGRHPRQTLQLNQCFTEKLPLHHQDSDVRRFYEFLRLSIKWQRLEHRTATCEGTWKVTLP